MLEVPIRRLGVRVSGFRWEELKELGVSLWGGGMMLELFITYPRVQLGFVATPVGAEVNLV